MQRRRSNKQFKHAILKNLLLGLRKYARGSSVASRSSSTSTSRAVMSFYERKKAVRLAADAALAAARGTAPCWSRSLAAELFFSHGLNAVEQRPATRSTTSSSSESTPRMSMTTRKWTLVRRPRGRRSLLRAARPKSKAAAADWKAGAGILARDMIRKRTMALRELVPGGRRMDECTLLEETLDYAVSLKAQVDAMQLLVRALQQAPTNNPAMMKHHQ